MQSRMSLLLKSFLSIYFVIYQDIVTLSYPGLNERTPHSTKNSIGLGQRHFIIVTADTQYLWCSYYFGVHNRSSDSQLFEVPIQLPKNTEDFTAQDGLTKDDLHLKETGDLFIKKKFKPGLNVISIGFKIPIDIWGENIIKLSFPYGIQEFSIATQKSTLLDLSSPDLEAGVPNMLSQSEYVGLIGSQIRSDKTMTIEIKGLPMGHSFSLIAAAISAIILFSFAIFFSLKNHILLKKCKTSL